MSQGTSSQRKQTEVGAKCRAFLESLSDWQAEVATLPQHTSQLTRLMRLFRPLGERLAARISGANPPKPVDALAEVLLLFRIWAFYRQKLDQRFVPAQRAFLEIADDLAYRWWLPARTAAVRASGSARYAKEPPLVFLNGDVSPFTVTRKLGFQAEDAVGLHEHELKWSTRVLSQAPVPVIAVPYFASRHIPDLMVIAHEVGHNVEDDFDLTGDLDDAVASALDNAQGKDVGGRGLVWGAWREEVFADLWGVLVGGPAFVDALIDFLADDPGTIAKEQRSGDACGTYPTVWLRAQLLFAALEQLGLEQQAATRRAAFIADYPGHAMGEYVQDIPTVIQALLDCRPRSFHLPVRTASGFDALVELENERIAHAIAEGMKRDNPNTGNLAKAMSLAFHESPEAISGDVRSKALWKRLRCTVQSGIRSSEKTIKPEDVERFDASAVESLFDELVHPGQR